MVYLSQLHVPYILCLPFVCRSAGAMHQKTPHPPGLVSLAFQFKCECTNVLGGKLDRKSLVERFQANSYAVGFRQSKTALFDWTFLSTGFFWSFLSSVESIL